MNENTPDPTTPRAPTFVAHSLAGAGLCLLLTAPPAATTRLDLTVDYTGPEEVDAAHPISVLVFDGPDFSGGSTMVAAGHATRSGKTLSFTDLPETVYLVAIYDPSGNFTGLSGIIPGSVIGAYAAEGATQPSPVQVGKRTKLAFEFDDQARIPGEAESVVPAPVQAARNGIVEIRTYTIKEGMRDQFVTFFEEKTLKEQKKAGLRVVGQFRSLEDENRFVWIRAYESQEERVRQLRDYYLGPDWIRVQAEAGTFIADTEVMLVEPTALSSVH